MLLALKSSSSNFRSAALYTIRITSERRVVPILSKNTGRHRYITRIVSLFFSPSVYLRCRLNATRVSVQHREEADEEKGPFYFVAKVSFSLLALTLPLVSPVFYCQTTSSRITGLLRLLSERKTLTGHFIISPVFLVPVLRTCRAFDLLPLEARDAPNRRNVAVNETTLGNANYSRKRKRELFQ